MALATTTLTVSPDAAEVVSSHGGKSDRFLLWPRVVLIPSATDQPRRWTRQGRAVGRAPLVGHATLEEAAALGRCQLQFEELDHTATIQDPMASLSHADPACRDVEANRVVSVSDDPCAQRVEPEPAKTLGRCGDQHRPETLSEMLRMNVEMGEEDGRRGHRIALPPRLRTGEPQELGLALDDTHRGTSGEAGGRASSRSASSAVNPSRYWSS